MDRARRVLPLRQDARRGEVHASGRCAPVRRHDRRSRRAGGAVSVPDANGTAQPESRRGPDSGAGQLRGVRDRGGRHPDSALIEDEGDGGHGEKPRHYGGTEEHGGPENDFLLSSFPPFLRSSVPQWWSVSPCPGSPQEGEARMTKWTLRCVVLGGVLMAGASLQAHHSLAGAYALGKEAKITGSFTAFRLVNPHSSLKLEVKESDGKVREWSITGGSVTALARFGIGRNADGPNALHVG